MTALEEGDERFEALRDDCDVECSFRADWGWTSRWEEAAGLDLEYPPPRLRCRDAQHERRDERYLPRELCLGDVVVSLDFEVASDFILKARG